jgi:hypothetical protein
LLNAQISLLLVLTASFDRDGDGDVDGEDMADPTDIERALDCATALANLAKEPSNRAALVQVITAAACACCPASAATCRLELWLTRLLFWPPPLSCFSPPPTYF